MLYLIEKITLFNILLAQTSNFCIIIYRCFTLTKERIMNKHHLLIISLSASLFLGGCVSTSESMKAQGYPAAYADGFEDGCHSGKKAGGSYFDQFKKDVNRFNSDKEYAQGWTDSFRQCETEQEALDRQTRMSIEWQRMDNDRKNNFDSEASKALSGIDTSGLESLK